MPTAAAKVRMTKIWADTLYIDTCRDARCGKRIYKVQNAKTGNFAPFDNRPVPIEETKELDTNRVLWTIDLAQAGSHFATCPGRDRFRRRR